MTESFRWAFIGTGTLAKKVAREITATGRHVIATAYSRNREKLLAYCEPYGTYAATSIRDAIDRPDVDAVYISVTNESHFEVCRQALELGKSVHLEKQFTMKASETEALQKLAKDRNLYLAEAMWTWFADVPNAVKAFVRSGKLGKIRDVYMSYCAYSIGYAPRVSDPLLGGGALLDIGIYPVTYAYRLFGYPKKVVCKGELENGIDYCEHIIFSYDGFDVNMDVSIVDTKGEALIIEGENGFLANPGYHYGESGVAKTKDGIEIFKGQRSYAKEFDTVADEIRSGRTESAFIPAKATLDCMRILDECRAQMNLVYPFEKQD